MEADKKTYVIRTEENIGEVLIANDVVGMIASIAATEVEGVCAMGNYFTNELMSKVGMKNIGRNVKTEVFGKNVKVELIITMDYGYNIPGTCQKVQAKVKQQIESMTGLLVRDVNIKIAGISLQKSR